MSKRIALYLRVSTTEQTVENQQRELEAVAERHVWNVVAVFTDAGISGTKGREKRPGYDCLCRGIARREFDQVSAWSVDRLGRSLQELVAFLGELHAKMSISTCTNRGSTPARQPERRCFRCSVSLPSSSAPSLSNGSNRVLLGRGARESGSGGVR
jgi:DNA invertase Pin-like site-specific DNA recombinase